MITIVDDDPWARGGLKDLVMSLGYDVRTFASAEEFIASGNIADTVCLITDLRMPGLSGLDLQECLRRDDYRTPVIFVTAHENEADRARAFEGGAFGFLSKPLSGNDLAACLAAAFEDAAASPS